MPIIQRLFFINQSKLFDKILTPTKTNWWYNNSLYRLIVLIQHNLKKLPPFLMKKYIPHNELKPLPLQCVKRLNQGMVKLVKHNWHFGN